LDKEEGISINLSLVIGGLAQVAVLKAETLKKHHSLVMASGIEVSQEVVSCFQEIKLSHKFRYVIFKRNADNTIIEIEKTADPSKTYDDFVADIPANECRYAIFDLEYQKSDADGLRQKIVFIVWAPDAAKIKDKMLTASSKDAIKKQLVGISTEVQATDASEIEYSYILEKVQTISR
jgi:cofilin